jgi:hypothetical protein
MFLPFLEVSHRAICLKDFHRTIFDAGNAVQLGEICLFKHQILDITPEDKGNKKTCNAAGPCVSIPWRIAPRRSDNDCWSRLKQELQ